MAIGIIWDLYFFKAFKYSIAKVLFGWFKMLEYFWSFKYSNIAFSLAFGKESPFFNSSFKNSTYCFGSSYKITEILFNISISEFSEPNETVSTIFKEFKSFIAPSAKFSALEIEYTVGSSKTKSIPLFRAISVFTHLLTIDVLPLWTKLPLIIQILYSAPVSSLDLVKCKRWPLWNGLYSAIIPKTFDIFISPYIVV